MSSLASLDRSELDRLAAAHGIEPSYFDIWGRTHETPEDVARAILHSLGVREGADDEAEKQWSSPLDETLVVREGEAFIRLRIPVARNGASVKLEIQWENGEIEHHWHWLPTLETLESAMVGGTEYLAKRFPLPSALRLGYHNIRACWMKDPEIEVFAEARFIICPQRTRPVEGRQAGLALSLYGVRSSRNWGCGDFTDLRAITDAFAPAGAAFIALNPLHAIANRQPFNTSPYLPETVFYRNFIYLDVERVGDAGLSAAEKAEIAQLRSSEFVEYERVAKIKLAVLRRIFERFQRSGGSPEFNSYIESEGQLLEDYAVFCSLDQEMHARNPDVWVWTQWPAEYQDPRSDIVREFAVTHRDEIDFRKFLQWHLAKQAAETHAYALSKGMQIGLYHDLALATDRYGADLWAHRPFFVTGCRVGSPPDDFSPSGQDWSFPPPNRDQHKKDGYQVFAKSIRKAAAFGGALRIDHVMRFFRLYWIPEGMPASEGAYVRDYANDLLGILALESHRGNFVVIGEDLGTVTDEVRHGLSEAGILSYRLLWFERNGEGKFRRPEEYPRQALVSTTTHDLATLAGFAVGADIEARKSAGLIDETEYQRQKESRATDQARLQEALSEAGFTDDPLRYVLATSCALAAINQEDLTGETQQQNLPGSTSQHPNWRRKMRVPVEEIASLAEKFAEAVRRSGRNRP